MDLEEPGNKLPPKQGNYEFYYPNWDMSESKKRTRNNYSRIMGVTGTISGKLE